MAESFQSLSAVKSVLIMHLLRQQIEGDLRKLVSTPLNLSMCLVERLQCIHSMLLHRVANQKRLLRQYGVRIIEQTKNTLDFQIAYVERGYQVQHRFLLATLRAEAQVLFKILLEGGTE